MKKAIFTGMPALLALVLLLSCSSNPTGNEGTFDVYGRVVYRPLIAGSSSAEFSLFHDGGPLNNAIVVVNNDTIPLADTVNGHYSQAMQLAIGETLSYRVESPYGSASGQVIVPDTVSIVKPAPFDTLSSAQGMLTIWRRNFQSDGYFAYLEHQNGFVAAITANQIDTTAILPAENIIRPGLDRFWVENLNGYFDPVMAPNGKIMPKGVVAAAANYKDVYVAQ